MRGSLRNGLSSVVFSGASNVVSSVNRELIVSLEGIQSTYGTHQVLGAKEKQRRRRAERKSSAEQKAKRWKESLEVEGSERDPIRTQDTWNHRTMGDAENEIGIGEKDVCSKYLITS
jgi:cell shape-determining protein MreC